MSNSAANKTDVTATIKFSFFTFGFLILIINLRKINIGENGISPLSPI